MKTLVIQSYRTHGVAAWITRCIDSVAAWARVAGYGYEFMDDRFFDFAPAWIRRHCARQLLPVTDVARLHWIRARHAQGYDRVIWVDADVLVFDPDAFRLDGVAGYSLCRELWLGLAANGDVELTEKVCNAVTVLDRGHPLLDFWLFSIDELLAAHHPEEIEPLVASTQWLTNLAMAMPVRVLPNVGLFSPPLVAAVATDDARLIRAWAQRFGHPIAAVNLCASLQDRDAGGGRVSAAQLDAAVDRLLATRGAVVNALIH